MDKPLKGAIALAAAGALLLGGAGTYALWSDSVTLDGGSINAGQLDLSVIGSGAWADISSGTPVPITDIADFLIVPGDVLTYSVSAEVRAVGDNLEATLAADPASITSDDELLGDIDITTDVSIDGTDVTVITEANDEDTVDVVVTFTFDAASTNVTQTDAINLAEFALTVDQNPR